MKQTSKGTEIEMKDGEGGQGFGYGGQRRLLLGCLRLSWTLFMCSRGRRGEQNSILNRSVDSE